MQQLLLTIAVVAALALAVAGGWAVATRRDSKRGWLMIAVAAVTLFNIWSWGSLPGAL